MNDIIQIIKFLEGAGSLIKGASETIKNESKEQKGVFLDMLLGTIGSTLFGNILTGKGVKWSKIPGRVVIRAGEGRIRTGEGTIKAGQDF